jgi:outer membrane receptor protein involved in Fe transport
LAILSFAGICEAQDLDSLKYRELELVEVVSRSAQRIFDLPFSVSSLKLDHQFLGFLSLPEQLQLSPGVLVQKTTHHGGSPFLRGLTGNQSLSVIDGIRLNNSTFRYGPNQYLNTIDLFAVDKIDVLLGAGSVDYGSDAMGGVVSITSHQESYRANAGWGAQFLARGTSAGQEGSTRSKISYQSKKLAAHLGFTSRNFGDILAGGRFGMLNPSGFRAQSLDSKIRLRAKNGEWIGLIQSNQQFDIPDYVKYSLEGWMHRNTDLQGRELAYLRRIYEGNSPWNAKFTLGHQRQRELRSQQRDSTKSVRTEQDRVGTWFMSLDGARTVHCWDAPFKWHVGTEVYTDLVQSSRFDSLEDGSVSQIRALYPNNSRASQAAVYSSIAGQLSDELNLHAGFRGTINRVYLEEASLGAVRDRTPSFIYELGFNYKWSPILRTYGLVSTGFRAPNIDDYGTLGIVDFRYEVPSYGLRPEQINRWELGFKSQGLVAWRGSVYVNYLTDLIDRIPRGDSLFDYPVYQKANVQNAAMRGFELAGSREFRNWTATGQCSYVFGQNRSKSEPMRRIPPFMCSGLVSYSSDFGTLRGVVRMNSSQKRLSSGDVSDNRIGPNGTPGFIVLDLGYSIGLNWFKMPINLSIQGQNLANVLAKYHGSGVFIPGRCAVLTGTLNLN